jgi:hypothetical protein
VNTGGMIMLGVEKLLDMLAPTRAIFIHLVASVDQPASNAPRCTATSCGDKIINAGQTR